MAPVARVLVIEDDRNALDNLAALLTAEGYDVIARPDGTDLDTIIDRNPPDIAIIDRGLPTDAGGRGREPSSRRYR